MLLAQTRYILLWNTQVIIQSNGGTNPSHYLVTSFLKIESRQEIGWRCMDKAVWWRPWADSSLYTIELHDSAPGNWKDTTAALVFCVREMYCFTSYIPPIALYVSHVLLFLNIPNLIILYSREVNQLMINRAKHSLYHEIIKSLIIDNLFSYIVSKLCWK